MSFRYSCCFKIALCALAIAAWTQTANAATEAGRTEFSKHASASCPSAVNCVLNLGVVPPSHVWLIKYVSCHLRISNVGGRVLYWYLTAIRRGTEFGQVQLRPTALGTAPNEHTHSATELAYLRAPTGSTLAVVVSKDDSSAGNIAQVTCTIGGDNIRLKS